MERVVETVTLAYRDGTSNKVYRIDLIEVREDGEPRGYLVTGFNKRRDHSNFVPQPKITIPTTLSRARAAFSELENKKCSSSYKTPYHVESRSIPATAETAATIRTPERSAITRRSLPAPRMRTTTATTRLPDTRDTVMPDEPATEEESGVQPRQPKHRMDMLEF